MSTGKANAVARQKGGSRRIFMAITRNKKHTLVAEVSELLATSKLTVFASYNGLSVADLQDLRRAAREAGVVIKVVKNRLVRVALSENATYKNADTSLLTGQLLYAVSAEDEVSPAKVLDTFAKTHPALQFVGAFGMEGEVMSADAVKALASLPSKNELIGQVVATLLSPINEVTNALSGNLHALLDGVEAHATA
jgi:large subunit ribosomal protein L10